ncbi:MAG: outer membrane beta-barrel protein [Nitrospirae bacterium]|nr:outer membrane beta-barrel protein [Nitrospirota bacterium]
MKAQFKSIRWQFTGPLAGSRDPNSMGDINTRNRQESYSSLALGGRVAQKTYLFVQGLFQREHYEVNKDLDSAIYTGALGVIWEGTAKSAGEFSVGWQTRNMDRASTRGSGASSGLYMNGGMQWKPQEQTHLNWNLYRRTSETVLANTLYYTATGTRLDMVHAVTRKWNVTAQVNYERDTYSDQIFGDGTRGARQDDYLTFGGGLWYQIQPWLGARLTYLYTERLSNVMSVQYNANQTMASIQAQF